LHGQSAVQINGKEYYTTYGSEHEVYSDCNGPISGNGKNGRNQEISVSAEDPRNHKIFQKRMEEGLLQVHPPHSNSHHLLKISKRKEEEDIIDLNHNSS
jgi:hypothetical protein